MRFRGGQLGVFSMQELETDMSGDVGRRVTRRRKVSRSKKKRAPQMSKEEVITNLVEVAAVSALVHGKVRSAQSKSRAEEDFGTLRECLVAYRNIHFDPATREALNLIALELQKLE